ncbi:MAG: hypothetical protein WBM90_12285 [Acidimicrobiia bacterium]
MSSTLVRRASEILDRPVSRRGFLRRLVYGATALTVAPMSYMLRPGTAYAAICSCSGQSCNCGDTCCDGYTEFCCSMYGENVCPTGTIPMGWWKADGSGICDDQTGAKPRYYLDCNIADCGGCGCGSNGICSGACQEPDVYTCGCGNGNCGYRKTACTGFRYGQCNQEVACVGPIVCRVVTCTPPWVWDDSCTTTSATDNNTRFHDAACLRDADPLPNGRPVIGDWTGDGIQTPGIFANGVWHLRRSDGGPNIVFTFGASGDLPIVGDWNGDGVDTPGVFRRGTWHLRNSNTTGVADFSFGYGDPGDSPFVGDWTGNGIDTPGLYRRSDGKVYLRNTNTTGFADIEFFFGIPLDLPIAGDFNGNGQDTVSIYRPSEQRFYIINKLGKDNGGLGFAEYSYRYGAPGDVPLIGDYNGDGVDTPGIYRSGTFYLRNQNSAGNAHLVIP